MKEPRITRLGGFLVRQLRNSVQGISFTRLASPKRGAIVKRRAGAAQPPQRVSMTPLDPPDEDAESSSSGLSSPTVVLPAAEPSPQTAGAGRSKSAVLPSLAPRTRIRLLRADCEVVVMSYDMVGNLHRLRDEEAGEEWHETLYGRGCVQWEMVAPPPTPEEEAAQAAAKAEAEAAAKAAAAPPPRAATRLERRAAQKREREALWETLCPICFDPLEELQHGARAHRRRFLRPS